MSNCENCFVPLMHDKEETIKIDVRNYNRNQFSSGNGYRPDDLSAAIKTKEFNFDEWLHKTEEIILESIDQTDVARELINDIHQVQHSCTHKLEIQADRITNQLNGRVQELLQSLAETRFRKEQVEFEMNKLSQTLHSHDINKEKMVKFMQLAQTRRYDRLSRPFNENGHDSAQESLDKEVQDLAEYMHCNESNSAKLRAKLAELGAIQKDLKQEIGQKVLALEVDENVIQMRQRLALHPATNQTPCNMTAAPTKIRVN
ncbi:hypothetical protein Ciccas_001347 [Cichlidogyrus casuarinus]|uniref:Tektin n=1 Tax=Cichlidogyrus casuarinus TaxID=1844966 RepID=A0ABD2QK90_9PLAT